MGLWAAPDFLALSCCGPQVRGVRMRRSGGVLQIVRAASSGAPLRRNAIQEVLDRLGGSRNAWLLIGIDLEDGDFFHIEMPDAPLRELAGALRFEAPHEVMMLPKDFQIQFLPGTADPESGTIPVDCCVFSDKTVQKWMKTVAHLRRKPDGLLSPLLTLPRELPADAPVHFPDLEVDFYRCNGAWRPWKNDRETPCNRELLEILRRECRWNRSAGEEDFENFLTAVLLARFGLTRLWDSPKLSTALQLLPPAFRPARYRTQLRIMVLLLLTLGGLWGWYAGGRQLRQLREYRAVRAELAATKERVAKLKKNLKNTEREQKELSRIAELKIGDRNIPTYISLISEKLPDDVLVSSLRWNDGTIDLVLQTEAEIDLVSFFNRLNGFKVASGSQRTGNNGLTFANIKLSTPEAGGRK